MKYLLAACKSAMKISAQLILVIFFLVVSLLQFKSASLYADEKLPPLKKGMSYVEVVNAWGGPEEKIEKEIKRKDIWLYKNKSRVVFENGVLLTVLNGEGKDILDSGGLAETLQKEAAIPKAISSRAPDQDVVDDILNEIMKDPSNSEGGGANNQGIINPQIPPSNVINQVPPPEVVN